jgi:hypothetical protein
MIIYFTNPRGAAPMSRLVRLLVAYVLTRMASSPDAAPFTNPRGAAPSSR